MNENPYQSLACLLNYPEQQFKEQVDFCLQAFRQADPPVAEHLEDFFNRIHSCSVEDLQELYTHTFDVNPVCSLDVGYHIFGESYQRGAFLSRLRETESEFEFGEQKELPDHLPVLLQLLPRLADEEFKQSLLTDCMIPAVTAMEKALAESDNPYRPLIAAARLLLQHEEKRVSSLCTHGTEV